MRPAASGPSTLSLEAGGILLSRKETMPDPHTLSSANGFLSSTLIIGLA
jgi:hypothetical protein